jgi:hypothetical protein
MQPTIEIKLTTDPANNRNKVQNKKPQALDIVSNDRYKLHVPMLLVVCYKYMENVQ